MPRPSAGPRLELYGPDSRFGARAKKGFKDFIWYIVWYEGRLRRERSTGTGERKQAEEAFGAWLTERSRERRATQGPRGPAEMTVAEALTLYTDVHAPKVVDGARIAFAVDALLPFWGSRPVSDVKAATCELYGVQRKKAPGTIRRELETLRAAINFSVRQGYLTLGAPVTLPGKPPAKERWLSRSEAAALIRAARKDPRARRHLPLFILIALYTGARKESILQLQWKVRHVVPTEGGVIDLAAGIIDFNGGRPTTKKRRAKVPIPHRLMRFLAPQRRLTDKWVLEQKVATPDDRLARAPIASIKHSFATACINAKLEDVTPHVLKHTCITWMLQRGVDEWDVAGWTETSVDTIRRVYGHHSPHFLERAKRAFD